MSDMCLLIENPGGWATSMAVNDAFDQAVNAEECDVLAILCVGAEFERWTSTVMSLVAARVPILMLVNGNVEHIARIHENLPVRIETWTLSKAGEYLMGGPWRAGFVATVPVVVPREPFESAAAALNGDIRICTVSFYSNNANYLSFPVRNSPSGLVVNGHNEETITRRLRSDPLGQDVVPIPVPAGGGILISTLTLRALGGIDGFCPTPEIALLDIALRGVQRGFRNVLDSRTFIVRPLQSGGAGDALSDEGARNWLHYRHHFFPALYDSERDSSDTPLADSISLRGSAIVGLRILVDGSCLGPYEMGTQVALLAQVDALINHPSIREVVVAAPNGQIPAYASRVLLKPGITMCSDSNSMFPNAGQVDIILRPFQATAKLPFEHWRSIARRTVVTILDLIAYDNGNYHGSSEEWLAYRHAIRDSARQADAVLVISNDTAETVREARLPVNESNLKVIEMGTNHLQDDPSEEQVPIELLESGLASSVLVLVLGATYSHKNRDLAIRAWQELRARGYPVTLVLAGVVVPLGSTRNQEALVVAQGEWPVTLADVTSAERNWLLRHASVVLYPTSAEGFGLVPFEAAALGTPTVFVPFGPLQELLPQVPVAAAEWSPSAFADAVGALLDNPELAREQVAAVLSAATEFTWDRYAGQLVDVFRQVLARAVSR